MAGADLLEMHVVCVLIQCEGKCENQNMGIFDTGADLQAARHVSHQLTKRLVNAEAVTLFYTVCLNNKVFIDNLLLLILYY